MNSISGPDVEIIQRFGPPQSIFLHPSHPLSSLGHRINKQRFISLNNFFARKTSVNNNSHAAAAELKLRPLPLRFSSMSFFCFLLRSKHSKGNLEHHINFYFLRILKRYPYTFQILITNFKSIPLYPPEKRF